MPVGGQLVVDRDDLGHDHEHERADDGQGGKHANDGGKDHVNVNVHVGPLASGSLPCPRVRLPVPPGVAVGGFPDRCHRAALGPPHAPVDRQAQLAIPRHGAESMPRGRPRPSRRRAEAARCLSPAPLPSPFSFPDRFPRPPNGPIPNGPGASRLQSAIFVFELVVHGHSVSRPARATVQWLPRRVLFPMRPAFGGTWPAWWSCTFDSGPQGHLQRTPPRGHQRLRHAPPPFRRGRCPRLPHDELNPAALTHAVTGPTGDALDHAGVNQLADGV
jgi:hypothetical protein